MVDQDPLARREGSLWPPKVPLPARVSPLADRVVVKAIVETEQMRGGLHIPDTAKEKPQQGDIIAVGAGRFDEGKRVPMEVKSWRQGALWEIQRHRSHHRQ